MYVDPESQSVACGNEFTATIMVDPKGYGISRGEINLTVQPASIEIVSVEAGNLLGMDPQIGKRQTDNETGTWKYTLSRSGSTVPQTPRGSFMTVTFHVKENAAIGKYTLDIVNASLFDENFDDIPFIQTQNGITNITREITGTIKNDTDTSTSTPTLKEVPIIPDWVWITMGILVIALIAVTTYAIKLKRR